MLPRSRRGGREKDYRLRVEGIVRVMRLGSSSQTVAGCYHRSTQAEVWVRV